jgi:hypothetical protein
MSRIAESLHRLAADFAILCGAKFHEGFGGCCVFSQTCQISESPDTMKASGDGFTGCCRGDEKIAVFGFFSERDL